MAQEQVEKSLKDNLPELVDWVKKTADSTGQFLQEQTPLLIQEYLNWVFWDNLLSVVIILSIFIPSVIISCKSATKADFDDGAPFSVHHLKVIIFGFLSIITFFPAMFEVIPSIKEIVKVKTAPRVVIVEKLKELVK